MRQKIAFALLVLALLVAVTARTTPHGVAWDNTGGMDTNGLFICRNHPLADLLPALSADC